MTCARPRRAKGWPRSQAPVPMLRKNAARQTREPRVPWAPSQPPAREGPAPRVGTCGPGGLRTGGGLGLRLCALVPTRSPAPTPASSHPSAPGPGGRREPGPRFRPGSRPLAAAAAPRPRAALGSQPRGRGGAGAGRGLAWERRWQPRCAGPRPAGPAGPLNPPLFARCHTALPA